MTLKIFYRRFSKMVELTKDRYTHIKRAKYSELNSKHLVFFENLLGKDRVITDQTELLAYNQDWLKNVRGYSSVALRPKTTNEVSVIMEFCNKENLAVCPQGGNTGLVGGSVPVFDEVIISMNLMNKIKNIDSISGVLTCESGCVLEKLDNELQKYGLMMPLDLGSKGSCQIGGNLSTCAGGLRLLRYGSLQGNTLGMELVKADGVVISNLNTLRKNNTGYPLHQFLIGSEGTLGIITAAVIKCPPRPTSVNLAYLGLDKFEDVVSVFNLARNHLSEILSSCEMMDSISIQKVEEKLGLKSPLGQHSFYMIIETHGSHPVHDEEKMNMFVEKGISVNVIQDAIVTSEPSKMLALWQLRERITEALLKNCYVYKYDISLPLSKFYEIVGVIEKRLQGTAVTSVSGFGHIGDGNIHLNVETKEFDQTIFNKLEPFIFEWTAKQDGSISAEHGLGFKKAQFIHYAKSSQAIELMKTMKLAMDPKCILNPYKVFPLA